VHHEIADDLESFFYVFVWFCVSFAGPNEPIEIPSRGDNRSIFYSWGEGALAPGGLTDAVNAKSTLIHAPNDKIESQFTPYFSNMTVLAQRWKDLVQEEDLRRSPHATKRQRSTMPLTHRAIVALLKEYVINLPDSDVFPFPEPHRFKLPEPPDDRSGSPDRSKRPPPSPSSSPKTLTKRRRNNSSGSIGTAWLPSRK
jgi:hypothetical protein